MDELRKIPPVTRFLVLGTLAITLPVLGKLLPIYPLVSPAPRPLLRPRVWSCAC